MEFAIRSEVLSDERYLLKSTQSGFSANFLIKSENIFFKNIFQADLALFLRSEFLLGDKKKFWQPLEGFQFGFQYRIGASYKQNIHFGQWLFSGMLWTVYLTFCN